MEFHDCANVIIIIVFASVGSFKCFCYLKVLALTNHGKKTKHNFDGGQNGLFFMPLLLSVEFFQKTFFSKILSGTLLNVKQFGSKSRQTLCQSYWVQTVCKGYQQMKPDGKVLTH